MFCVKQQRPLISPHVLLWLSVFATPLQIPHRKVIKVQRCKIILQLEKMERVVRIQVCTSPEGMCTMRVGLVRSPFIILARLDISNIQYSIRSLLHVHLHVTLIRYHGSTHVNKTHVTYTYEYMYIINYFDLIRLRCQCSRKCFTHYVLMCSCTFTICHHASYMVIIINVTYPFQIVTF